MPSLHFTAAINAPPQAVFDRLADFAHYDNWLPPSNMFKTIMEVSDNPLRLGSTYVDKGTNSTMYGEVTVYEPPQKITFLQVIRVKFLFVTRENLKITIAYKLEEDKAVTNLTRDVTIQLNGSMLLLQSWLVKGIAAENRRILAALKLGLEQSA